MKTSYFSKYKETNGVSIAIGTPKWFAGPQEPRLFPTWEMVHGIRDGSLSPEDYEKQYNEILSKLDPHAIYDQYEDSVLLCWEKIGQFCHRRLVANWIEENTGHIVEEYGIWR